MNPVEELPDDAFGRMLYKAVALPDAPPALLRSAVGLWPADHPRQVFIAQAATQAVLRRMRAALSFDSWAFAPQGLGVRSLPSAMRHLLFSAEGRDFDLRIAPADEYFALSGQVLGPDESGQVELQAQPDASGSVAGARSTSLDGLGEFRLDAVHAGTYVLTLRVGADEIVLPPITVGPRPG